MSIETNSIITWKDFSNKCLSSIKNVCCNIDTYASNVPNRLKSDQSKITVKTQTIGITSSKSTQDVYFYATPSNLISIVAKSLVEEEWNLFLSEAGINSRSNNLIQAKELTLAVGLYMQFMSYHIKSIYSRRQVYNTIESQSVFQGCKYVTGKVTPKYVLNPATIDDTTTDEDIKNIVNQNIQANQLITHYDNPMNHKCTLS